MPDPKSNEDTLTGSARYPHRYTARMADDIETAWQQRWALAGAFTQPNPADPAFDSSKPKFYCLDMFPYPSGAGLHVGHPEGYTATDIISRYKRMKGFNVLHPMGWDAFGLPAEQYAIQTGVHPALTTRKAIDNFRRQLQRFGFSYDWSREFATIDPDYYKWTQWVWLKAYNSWYDPVAAPRDPHETSPGRARPIAQLVQMLEEGNAGIDPSGRLVRTDLAHVTEALGGWPVGVRKWHELSADERRAFIDDHRLAYLAEQTVNWCPALGTALANEEVIDGRSERGDHPVFRKPLRQWLFRITAYADRLLSGLNHLDWPASTIAMQTQWIGRSEGAEITFEVSARTSPGTSPGTPQGTPPLRGGTQPNQPPIGSPHPSPAQVLERLSSDPPPHIAPTGFIGRDPYPEGERGPVHDLVRFDRNLPHLRLPGATYFVSWKAEHDDTHFDDAGRTAILDALLHFDGDRCRVYAAVVMSNHVHWLVRPRDGHSLDELVESVKRFSARNVNAHQGASGHLWRREQFDHIVRTPSRFAAFLKYLLNNPIDAGVVDNLDAYPWVFVHTDAVVGLPEGERPDAATEWRHTQGSDPVFNLTVFTTRPDTIAGATYMVVAPEHPLVDHALANPAPETDAAALRAYADAARNRSDVERQESRQKTGVFTGLYAANPVTNTLIPIWTADYVLMGYGTGAIMAVPAHDERDFEFATAFKLPIRDVVYPRPVMAMAWYAERATDDETASDRWRTVLADLIGLIVARSIEPDAFDQALQAVRTKRADDRSTMEAVPGSPGSVGQTRGAVAAEWREAIDELAPTTFEDFRQRFATASHFAREGQPFTAPGFSVNTRPTGGMPTPRAKAAMTEWLADRGVGRAHVNYKLRDWLFSRQRYWGEPFPVVFDDHGRHYPLTEAALPVTLPDIADYTPEVSDEPRPLLAKAADWLHTTAGAAGVDPALLPPDTPVTREANTMPGWAGSCWYHLRYIDPRNQQRIADPDAERYWMGDKGVDLYIGGAEHAVLHLLYARFWHKLLYDLAEVSTPEPYHKLFHQGMILSYAYQRPDKTLVPVDQVELEGDPARDLTVFDPTLDDEGHAFIERATGAPVTRTTCKMSKSLKNVVNPDDIIEQFGADTFRLYEMYIGPLDASQPWRTTDMVGLYRFLRDAWRLIINEETGALALRGTPDPDVEKHLHRTIAKVEGDIERLAFNTAIAALIEFKNVAHKAAGLTADQASRFVRALCPFAPHIAEELWARLAHEPFCSLAPWPQHDPAMLRDDQVEVPVQIMGKVRARIMAPPDADAQALERLALADDKVQQLIAGKTVRKIVAIPGRMVNIVAG